MEHLNPIKPKVYVIPLSSNTTSCNWCCLGDESAPLESVVADAYEHVVIEFPDLEIESSEPPSEPGVYSRVND